MATIRYFPGLSFGVFNLAVSSPNFGSEDLLQLIVRDPIEGFDGFGRIFVFGEFEIGDGAFPTGRIDSFTFSAATEEGGNTSLKIEDVSIDAEAFFEALSVPDLDLRVRTIEDFILGGDDSIRAGSNDDLIYEADGRDTINAGAGNDVIEGGRGSDVIDGGSEVPRAFGTSVSDYVGPDNAAGDIVGYIRARFGVDVDLERGTAIFRNGDVDTLIDIEGISGSFGDDTLRGDAGDNLFVPEPGSDIIDGRGGFDVVSYGEFEPEPIAADLALGSVEVAGEIDTLENIEGVIGGTGRDTISGDGGDNILSGLSGADVLRGRGGADDFTFVTDDRRSDIVKDFVSGEDRLVFDASEFGIDGAFAVVLGDDPVATKKRPTFLFDPDDHFLRLDQDGRGSDDPFKVLKLKGVETLVGDDFALI